MDCFNNTQNIVPCKTKFFWSELLNWVSKLLSFTVKTTSILGVILIIFHWNEWKKSYHRTVLLTLGKLWFENKNYNFAFGDILCLLQKSRNCGRLGYITEAWKKMVAYAHKLVLFHGQQVWKSKRTLPQRYTSVITWSSLETLMRCRIPYGV